MNLQFVSPPEWWESAQCRIENIPVEKFFNKGDLRQSKMVCRRCEVRFKCLAAHLQEPFGVWGGHSKDERTKVMLLMDTGVSLADASQKIEKRK